MTAELIAAAFKAACRDELDVPKPGNVHVFAPSAQLTAADFIRSADAAAGPLAKPGTRVGARILGAVEATFAAVASNTNLGIVLLCAPLASAAEMNQALRTALAQVLDHLDTEDADLAFRAIVRASPAGLGHSPRHDVFAPAQVTLKQAMAEAADRDRVARQYVTGFADIFELGEPALAQALARWADAKWATLAVYLAFLSAWPDSHIVRKHGPDAAEEVRRTALTWRARLQSADRPDELLTALLAWDAALKRASLNPGTSADLTVATLFAHRLRKALPSARNNG